MPSPTAQDMYRAMHRLELGPRMRALGFKGSGGRYVLPDDHRWLVIGFQKNRYSTAACVSFTVNVTAADKQTWAAHQSEPWVPAQPDGNAAYPWTDTVRLGGLMPHGIDRWWQVGPYCSDASATEDVLDAIEHFALPWLQRWSKLQVTFGDPD